MELAIILGALAVICVLIAVFVQVNSWGNHYGGREGEISISWIAGSAVLCVIALISFEAFGQDSPISQIPESYYTPDRITSDFHFIYNEQGEPKLSKEEYIDKVFCSDPNIDEYLIWLIMSDKITNRRKIIIIEAFLRAGDLYCQKTS